MPTAQSQLVWSPIYNLLEERVIKGDNLNLLIVSFIKIEALKRLLLAAEHCKQLKVIVRWRIQDIVSGASDLDIYPYLRDKNVPLFFNEDIHLKLYIFESNVAFNTSGNLTLKGLGYIPKGNVEVGSIVNLTESDWYSIYDLIERSNRVNESIYNKMVETINCLPKQASLLSLPPWPSFQRRNFTIQAFPATEDANCLVDYYLSPNREAYDREYNQRAIHDLVILKMPARLAKDDALKKALVNFKEIPFVIAFVDELKKRGSMSFGAVSEWVHTNCENVPVPYRWEIKDSVRRLYNWLSASDHRITWNRPRHSIVIYWKESKLTK